MLTTRRGFTLIELLVSIILLGIVGTATMRMMMSMLNTSSAQMEIASVQGNARTGMLGLPLEFREIGYDTVPWTGGGISSDLEAIAPHRLTFRAARGMGITCGTPTTTEFRILKPVLGMRIPVPTDALFLFIESDPNLSLDDQWIPMLVSSIDYSSTCGADSAIRISLTAPPIANPVLNNAMVISMHRVGGPIRWYERVEYGPYVDPGTSEIFLGARSLSLGEATLSPVLGPLPDTTAFALTYFGANGSALNPAVAAPTAVRSIGLSLTTVSAVTSSLAGTTKRARTQTVLTTRIALRNALRP